jgi:hypothetical protein
MIKRFTCAETLAETKINFEKIRLQLPSGSKNELVYS